MRADNRTRPLLGVLVLLCLAGCSTDPAGPDPPCRAPRLAERVEDLNLILIVSDTMRSDRMGLYGGPARTPAFDRFAREHFYFDQAFTQAPWTKPAMATLFTSLYPSQHRLASHPELRQRTSRDETSLGEVDVLNDGFTTLAEILRQAGYRTAAFVSNPWMSAGFGFEQGFEIYDDSFSGWDADGREISRIGLRWLDGLQGPEKFFLYLHFIDAHQPYGRLNEPTLRDQLPRLRDKPRRVPPIGMETYEWLIAHPQHELSQESYRELRELEPNLELMELLYDLGIEEFDAALGTFLEGFATHPAYGRTAIVVTSDHGEAIYDRGYGNHGLGLHDDEIGIPLAARLPGVSVDAPRVECSAGLIDVMPTLCDYLALDCPEKLFGHSLLDGSHVPGYVVSEGVMFKPLHRTLRNRTFKLLWEPNGAESGRQREYALYNMREDAEERYDLLAPARIDTEHERVAEALARELKRFVPAFERPRKTFAPVSSEVERRLRALGYLD